MEEISEKKDVADKPQQDWRAESARIIQKASGLRDESLRLEGEYRLLKRLLDEGVV